MIRFLKFLIIPAVLLYGGWQVSPQKGFDTGSIHSESKSDRTFLSEQVLTGSCTENDTTLLRVAFLGDAEPKPLAEFPHMAAAVEQVNTLALSKHIDFVIGVGDIAHKGTVIQYEAATQVLQELTLPFYPIMGNEEHGSTIERYLYYAKQWNKTIESTRYTVECEQVAFVFASPDRGRDFNKNGAMWVVEQIQRLAPKPVVLVVHGAQRGVYPENRRKGINNRTFRRKVIPQPNLAMVISGDLHMDMDRVNHSKKIDHVHYLHIPALERTKIPDETNHTPMIRVMTIAKDGQVTIDTYAVGETVPRNEHTYSFTLSLPE
jgi:hypothetical protein